MSISFKSCLAWLLFSTTILAGADWTLDIRKNMPWSHFLLDGLKASAEGRYIQAASEYENAIAAISASSPEDRLELAYAYNWLGCIYSQMGRPQDAIALIQKGLAIWKDILGPNHSMVAIGLNNLSSCYSAMGKYRASTRLMLEALRIDERSLGPSALAVAGDLNNLGVNYVYQRKFSEAERAFRRAIEIGSSPDTPHPRLPEFTRNLACLMSSLNRVNEAEQMHSRVLQMQVKERGRRHASVGLTLILLAQCEVKLKKYGTAIQHVVEGMGIVRTRLGERTPQAAVAYYVLATAYHQTKRTDLAESAIEAALEIDKQTVVPATERRAHLLEYALVLRDEGRKQEAKVAEEMADEIMRQDPERSLSQQTVDLKELSSK